MKAHVGDRLIVSAHRVGEPERTGEIVEVRGPGGEPPYLVRWPGGEESLVYPGFDYRLVSREAGRDVVTEASEESFPSSDPPALGGPG
jgi:hypothetical protein